MCIGDRAGPVRWGWPWGVLACWARRMMGLDWYVACDALACRVCVVLARRALYRGPWGLVALRVRMYACIQHGATAHPQNTGGLLLECGPEAVEPVHGCREGGQADPRSAL